MDLSHLTERTFEVPSLTNDRCYTFLTNMSTGVTRWCRKAVEHFGLDCEFMTNVDEVWEKLIHPDDLMQYKKALEAIKTGITDTQDFTYRVKNNKGTYVLLTCRALVLHGQNGEPNLFAGTMINHGIEDNIDSVTLLHREVEFNRLLTEIVDNNSSAAVIKIGINNFNHFNVMYGFNFADDLLLGVADTLRRHTKERGYIYKLEGSKYAIVLPNEENQDVIKEFYKGIRKELHEGINIRDVELPVSVSAGAVIVEKDYNGTAINIKSDVTYALSESQGSFHGELVFFEDRSFDNHSQLELIAAIHTDILTGCNGFYMVYQPLIEPLTERVVGAEALVRWKNDTYGNVPPGIFIPWIETDAAFYKLGNWILNKTFSDMAELMNNDSRFICNVNIAAPQLEQQEFVNDVVSAVTKAGVPSCNVYLELTERCRSLDTELLRQKMDSLHNVGFNISLDDFGTGNSNFAILKDVPVDELKIDMSFVKNIERSEMDQSLVKSIIYAANEMGIRSCIEGVENINVRNFVDKYGATYYQGYFYSKPLLKEDFYTFVEEINARSSL